MEKRTRNTLRTVVNLAKKLAESDVRNAAEFLADHRVPVAIAVRVLAKRENVAVTR
jgi:hypothetical protein